VSTKATRNSNHSKADSIKVDSLAILSDPTNTLNIQGMNVMEIDSSGIMMLPLSLGSDESNSNSSSYLSRDNSRFWNIIFLIVKTNEHHLLTDKKMLINIENLIITSITALMDKCFLNNNQSDTYSILSFRMII